MFTNTSGELPLPDRAALLRFVRRGGAFIGTHSASDSLHSWPAFEGLLGGEFARHGAVQEGRLIVSRRTHPVTRGLPRSFALTDEFYEFEAPVPARTRVLIRLDPRACRTRPAARSRWFGPPYGEGRVFYDALGHLPATWEHRLHRRIVARGLAWALRR